MPRCEDPNRVFESTLYNVPSLLTFVAGNFIAFKRLIFFTIVMVFSFDILVKHRTTEGRGDSKLDFFASSFMKYVLFIRRKTKELRGRDFYDDCFMLLWPNTYFSISFLTRSGYLVAGMAVSSNEISPWKGWFFGHTFYFMGCRRRVSYCVVFFS